MARSARNRWHKPSFQEYRHWIQQYDQLDADDISAITRHIAQLAHRPLISIVVPAYNTPENYLREMIESVLAQVYPHWELCIADDASTVLHVREVLKSYADKDPRIKFITRETNGNISTASNSALTLVCGTYFGLLDHDDTISSLALYMMAVAINAHPNADIFYSDEDKLDAEGQRYGPYFKPDWNRELLYSQNYISHFGIYKTALVRHLGGFRQGFEGSQDYDLALRVVAVTKGPIVHIPHVLYHWRMFPGVTTFSSTQADRAAQAARLAIKQQLASLGEEVQVTKAVASFHRVVRPEPAVWPSVSVIVSIKDQGAALKQCVVGLLEKTDYPKIEIVIADNDSRDPATVEYLRKLGQRPGIRIVSIPGEFNFSSLNNLAAKQASGEILLFLDRDIAMTEPSWLKEMIIFAKREDVGAVGARILYPDRTVQHGGIVLGMELSGVAGFIHRGAVESDPGYFGRLKLNQDISCVAPTCMAIRKKVFDELGRFNDNELATELSGIDLCLRIRAAGYRIIYAPNAEGAYWGAKPRHLEADVSRNAGSERDTQYMLAHWAGELAADPFFSPNLSLQSATPDLAFPPRVQKPWQAAGDP